RAVHQGRALDNRMKRQGREDVLLEIATRRPLAQREPRARQAKDAALRHVQHALVLIGGEASAEGRLRHPLHELGDAAFANDPQAAVLDGILRAAGGEVPHEHNLLGVLADVDESTAAGDAIPEAARVDVALAVTLREAKKGAVESATVDEIELGTVIDQRARGDRGSARS